VGITSIVVVAMSPPPNERRRAIVGRVGMGRGRRRRLVVPWPIIEVNMIVVFLFIVEVPSLILKLDN
jgi:hypothetical protein